MGSNGPTKVLSILFFSYHPQHNFPFQHMKSEKCLHCFLFYNMVTFIQRGVLALVTQLEGLGESTLNTQIPRNPLIETVIVSALTEQSFVSPFLQLHRVVQLFALLFLSLALNGGCISMSTDLAFAVGQCTVWVYVQLHMHISEHKPWKNVWDGLPVLQRAQLSVQGTYVGNSALVAQRWV